MDIQRALLQMEEEICDQMILTSLCGDEQLKLSKRSLEAFTERHDLRPAVAFEYDASQNLFNVIR